MPQILDLVGLSKKSENFPDELSGGEQQRVSIARAFVNRPLILLADEPTGNLDPATTTGIMRLLDRINRTGTTVVMATHDSRIVDMMRRRVIELDRGSLVRDQAPWRLRRRELTSHCADTTRLLLARDVGLAAPEPADDAGRDHHGRGLALRPRWRAAALAAGRPRHPAVEERRRARDLHEHPRNARARSRRWTGRSSNDRDVRSVKYLTEEDAYNEFKQPVPGPAGPGADHGRSSAAVVVPGRALQGRAHRDRRRSLPDPARGRRGEDGLQRGQEAPARRPAGSGPRSS